MSSLVDRLRVRSERRPIYKLDESDDDADFVLGKAKKPQEKIERFVRDDAKEDAQACGESENLLNCETCTYAYHPKCLLPPLKAPFPSNRRCLECMCMVVEQNVHESVQISLTDRPASLKLRQDLQPLETIHEQINQILSPSQQKTTPSEQATLGSSKHVQAESQSKEAEFHSPSDQLKENDDKAAATKVDEMKDATTEPKVQGTDAVLNEELVKETSQSTSDSPPSAYPVTPPREPTCSPGTTEKDVGMVGRLKPRSKARRMAPMGLLPASLVPIFNGEQLFY